MAAAPRPAPALTARVGNLDTVRGIAAAGVLVFHVAYASGVIYSWQGGGWLFRLSGSVNVFFVLSGFVLFRPYALAAAVRGAWPGATRYAVRRFFRIVPAYWLLLVIAFLTVFDAIPDLVTWLRYLTFTQHYVPTPLMPGVAVAWTLTVEVVFYALLPFLAFALLRRPRRGEPSYRAWRPGLLAVALVVVGVVASIGWLSQMKPGRLSIYMHPLWFPTYAMCFAVGMAMAVASVALHTGTAGRWGAWLDRIGDAAWICWSLGLLCFGLSVYYAGPVSGLGDPTARQYAARELLFLGCATFVLLPVVFGRRRLPEGASVIARVAAAGSRALDRTLAHPVLRWVGTVSYGLFLWHTLIVSATAWLLGDGWWTNPYRLLAITLAGGLAAAALSWYLVEQPAMRLGDRLLGRLATPRRPVPVRQHADAPALSTADSGEA